MLLEQYVEKLYLSKVDDLLDEKCSKMCEEKIFQLQSILNAIICVDERFEIIYPGQWCILPDLEIRLEFLHENKKLQDSRLRDMTIHILFFLV